MPPKARIDADSFKQALSTLKPDQLRQLDTFATTDPLWGDLCVSMGKANNAENRRACYDAYKRKRATFQPFVNQLIQKNDIELIARQFDALPSPSNGTSEATQINSTPMQVAIVCQVCKAFYVSIIELFLILPNVRRLVQKQNGTSRIKILFLKYQQQGRMR